MAEFTVLRELLAEFGLSELYAKFADVITEESSPAEIELMLREDNTYRTRFAPIFERERNGDTPISAYDVINYERQLEQTLAFWGVPQEVGENVQSIAAQHLINDTSINQVEQRLAAQASFARNVLDDPAQDQEIVQELLAQGATLYDVANFALDPANTVEQVQRRLQAAEVANEASKARYGVTADEAMELSRQGLSGEQARQGFGTLTQSNQIVDRIVGDSSDPVTREQELAALTGDVDAQAAIARSARKRVAAFDVGGGFATDEEGFEGLR